MRQAGGKAQNGSRSQSTRARILAAAKTQFSSKGFERTTIRKVARAANIHPSMVIRYFRSKERLFAAAVTFDLRLPDWQNAEKQIGNRIRPSFCGAMEGPSAGDELPSLLRAAVTYPEARARMVEICEQQVTPYVTRFCLPKRTRECAALIATQLMGIAYSRYVLKLPAVANLRRETILRRVGATLQSYLMKS